MTRKLEPIACSLPLREAASQVGEWTDLHRHALSYDEMDGGVAVTYPIEMADLVEDLVAREAACCAWLSLETARTSKGIRVELASDNPEALPVIEVLAGLR